MSDVVSKGHGPELWWPPGPWFCHCGMVQQNVGEHAAKHHGVCSSVVGEERPQRLHCDDVSTGKHQSIQKPPQRVGWSPRVVRESVPSEHGRTLMMSVGRRPKLRREGGNRRWPAVMLPADPSS